jgi:hypothetical protein
MYVYIYIYIFLTKKEAQLPDFAAQQPFWRKIETGGLHSISGVSLLGKTLAIGGEERLVTACQVST